MKLGLNQSHPESLHILFNLMIQSSRLSPLELDAIVQKFLAKEAALQQLVQAACERNKSLSADGVVRAVMNKVREVILDLENDLSSLGKIQSLKLNEESSEDFLKYFSRIHEALVSDLWQDFVKHYLSIGGRRAALCQKAEPPYLESDRKLELYQRLVEWISKQHLFGESKLKTSEEEAPYQDPAMLFNCRDLELILKAYRCCAGKVQIMFEALNQIPGRGFENIASFKTKLENLVLIGMYEIYKQAVKVDGAYCISWRKFIKTHTISESIFPYLQQFLRISIRKDPSVREIRILANLLNRKFHMGEQSKPRRKLQELEKERKKIMMSLVKTEMSQILTQATSKPNSKNKMPCSGAKLEPSMRIP